MNKPRRILLAGTCAIAIFATATVAKADIPVIDTASLGEWVTSIGNELKSYALQIEQYAVQAKQWATENLSWLQQIQQYALQAEQYAGELMMLMNFIHSPSLGALLGMMNMAGLGNSLPGNPYAALGLVYGLQNLGNGGGMGALTGILSSLSQIGGQAWTTAHVYTPVDPSWTSAQLIQAANSNAGMTGAMSAAYGDLDTHSQTLQPIRSSLLNSSDTKSVLDATGQAAVETAWNVNQLGKINAMTGQYMAYQDVRRQRDDECLDMSIDAFLSTSPVTIGTMPGNPGPCPKLPPALPNGGALFGGTVGGGPGTNTIGPDPGDNDLILPPPAPPPPDPNTGSVGNQAANQPPIPLPPQPPAMVPPVPTPGLATQFLPANVPLPDPTNPANDPPPPTFDNVLPVSTR